jgi:hypothetical protein
MLLEASKWCDSEARPPTPLVHSKIVWKMAGKDVKDERSLVMMTWSEDSMSFEYSRPGLPVLRIHLGLFKEICWSIENSLVALSLALLPEGFDISNLPFDTIRDNPSDSESFLDRDDVRAWLTDVQTSMKKAYYREDEPRHQLRRSGKLQRSAVHSLLHLDQQFQRAMAANIVGEVGVSPRAILAALLSYRSDGEHRRNLYIMQDAVALAGGKEKAETRRGGRRGIVYFLSSEGGKILIRYLATTRQIIIEILQDAGFIETSFHYKTRIFAKYKTNEMEWQPSDITKSWCEATRDILGSDTSIVDMRQITTGIYGKLFPTVRYGNDLRRGASAVDGQGDHGRDPALENYGIENIFCFGNSGIELARFKLVSGICHALGGVGPVDATWPKEVIESPIFNHSHEVQALALARHLIFVRYLQHHSAEEARQTIQNLLKQLPFIFTTVCSPQFIMCHGH